MERSEHRILHIADSPNDTRLLGEQLRHCGIDIDLQRAGSLLALRAAMREVPSLVVVDMPLPWAEADLLAIRATHPRLPVVFRFGHPGNWHVDDPCEQIGRAVTRALALTHERPASNDDANHRAHVRIQSTLLQLGRLDYWDFTASLRTATAAIADLFSIERVSVWELGADGALTSLDLHTASDGRHASGTRLHGFPNYRRLLEEAVAIATPDARSDPRFAEFAGWYLEANGITSMLDTPIRKNGRVVGVLCLEHIGAPRSWTLMELEGAAALAHLLASGLETRDRIAAEGNLERARKAEALGKIAAQMAHDFNNRLTVITLLVDQMAQDATTPSQIEATRLLTDELARARDKVRTMLAGRATHPNGAATTDLCALVAAELPTLRRMLAPHALEFVPGNTTVLVTMSAGDLREALTNLVTNARDAMAVGNGKCTIRVRAPAHSGEAFAELIVEDNGHGLSPEAEQHLFEPFFTTKNDDKGSGLGLTSVQHSVQRAGGHVRVRSQQGRGTSVELAIPVLRRPANEAYAIGG